MAEIDPHAADTYESDFDLDAMPSASSLAPTAVDASPVVTNIEELLAHLELDDLEQLEAYCEDDMEILATVWFDDDDVGEDMLLISPVGSMVATGLEFPFTIDFFHETLTDIEEAFIGFA